MHGSSEPGGQPRTHLSRPMAWLRAALTMPPQLRQESRSVVLRPYSAQLKPSMAPTSNIPRGALLIIFLRPAITAGSGSAENTMQ